MLMGYMAVLLAFVLSLLRCIYSKVWRVEHVVGWSIAEPDNPPSTEYRKLDVSGVPTDRTENNNRTLDQSRVFEEV
jgi:hypothetical protein